MTLRDRLLKLRGCLPASHPGAEPAARLDAPGDASRVAQALARLARTPSRPDDAEIAAALGGEVVTAGLILVERRFPLDHHHGAAQLSEVLDAPLALLDESVAERAEHLLFLDTETTGLAGGTGTLPFLLGLARIEDDALRLRQFFLTGFKGEKALLAEALPWCREATHLVSFNGKAFDLPLLSARYRLARLPDPFVRHGHLDLLYPTRTAFANGWPDCRLQTAERRLLDFHRVDDLPGHLVPHVWFDFVRAGHFRQVPAILEHNRWDLVSLAGLAARLAQVFAQGNHPEADVLGTARRFCRQGEEQRAKHHLSARSRELGVVGLLELARLHRRRGEWEAAVAIWEPLAVKGCLEALERLAKYHEHVTRDLGQALAATERLLARQPHEPRHRHRHRRLLAKLGQR